MNAALAIDLTAPCWLHVRGLQSTGYAHKQFLGKTWRAHRLVWTLMRGPIPEGMVLDHLCRVKHCVNPQHLEVVTVRENTLRGTGISAIHAAKTHCKHGHPFDEKNTRYVSGGRSCRTCGRLNMAARRALLPKRPRASHNTYKTHCPKGHPYDEVNTRLIAGRRQCRACARERYVARRAA